jgi:hypothetical protein
MRSLLRVKRLRRLLSAHLCCHWAARSHPVVPLLLPYRFDFIRFSRPTAKILSSKSVIIGPFDGVPTLMLRVAKIRHIGMAEAEFRVMLFRNEAIKEDESARRFYPLKLQFVPIISFPVVLTLRHVMLGLESMTPTSFGWISVL